MRFISMILVLLLSTFAMARDDLLQCVDPDVSAIFLDGAFGEVRKVTRDLPDAYTEYTKPRAFSFIGSSVGEYSRINLGYLLRYSLY